MTPSPETRKALAEIASVETLEDFKHLCEQRNLRYYG